MHCAKHICYSGASQSPFCFFLFPPVSGSMIPGVFPRFPASTTHTKSRGFAFLPSCTVCATVPCLRFCVSVCLCVSVFGAAAKMGFPKRTCTAAKERVKNTNERGMRAFHFCPLIRTCPPLTSSGCSGRRSWHASCEFAGSPGG